MSISFNRLRRDTVSLAAAFLMFFGFASLYGAGEAVAQSGTIRTLPVPSQQMPTTRPPMHRRPMAPARVGQSTLKGRVVYKDNSQPLKGVRVRIFEGNSNSEKWEDGPTAPSEIGAFTNNAGEFQVENLASGKYYVTVEGAGISTPSGFGMKLPIPMSPIPTREDFEEIVPRHDSEFTVDGTNAIEIVIGIVRGGAIAGKVMKSNRPAAGVAVSVVARDGSGAGPFMSRFSAQTDKDGDYRLENLPPGEYLVAAATEDKRGVYDIRARFSGESQVVTYHPAAIRTGDATSVRIDSGRETNGVNITLVERNTVSVSGTVMKQDGSPLAGATVGLRNKDAEVVGALVPGLGQRTTTTDAEGRWSFNNVMEGSYIATALDLTSTPRRMTRRPGDAPGLEPSDREQAFRESRQRFLVAQQEVNVVGEVQGLSLIIAGPGSIRGSVAREDGAPLPSDLVIFPELFREGSRPGMPLPVRVRPDGSFVVNGIQGGDVYVSAALAPGSRYSIKSMTATGDDPRRSPVKIIEGAEAGPLEIVISPGVGTLTGKVVSEQGGRGLGGYVLLLVPVETARQRFRTAYPTARTTADGSYSLNGEPGEYFILARRRDEFPPIVTEDFVRAATAKAPRVVLVSGEAKQFTVRVP